MSCLVLGWARDSTTDDKADAGGALASVGPEGGGLEDKWEGHMHGFDWELEKARCATPL
jgi:hypothetical protein